MPARSPRDLGFRDLRFRGLWVGGVTERVQRFRASGGRGLGFHGLRVYRLKCLERIRSHIRICTYIYIYLVIYFQVISM